MDETVDSLIDDETIGILKMDETVDSLIDEEDIRKTDKWEKSTPRMERVVSAQFEEEAEDSGMRDTMEKSPPKEALEKPDGLKTTIGQDELSMPSPTEEKSANYDDRSQINEWKKTTPQKVQEVQDGCKAKTDT